MLGVQLPIGTLPIMMMCYETGQVAFARMRDFNLIVDAPESGIQALISNQDIYVGTDTEIKYGEMYDWQSMPELKAWIAAQNLDMPTFRTQ